MIPRVRAMAPRARIGCYGLYAAMNAEALRRCGADDVIGGEVEAALVSLAQRLRVRAWDAAGNSAKADSDVTIRN